MAEVWSAGDYAGMTAGPYQFYYGYEYDRDENGNEVWGFEAKKGGDTVLRVAWKPSWPDKCETETCLLFCIANFLEVENRDNDNI